MAILTGHWRKVDGNWYVELDQSMLASMLEELSTNDIAAVNVTNKKGDTKVVKINTKKYVTHGTNNFYRSYEVAK